MKNASLPASALCSLAFRWLALVLLAAFGVSAQAQDLGERLSIPGEGFSFRVPDGWKITRDEKAKSLTAEGTEDMAIYGQEVAFSGPLSELIKDSLTALDKHFVDFKKLDTEDFQTKSGMKGKLITFEHRTTKDGPKVRQMLFFFEGRQGHKIFITCGFRADADNRANRARYEDVAQSIRLKE